MDSLGRTTCLTGTDTVGDAYTPAGGAAVIVGVTNDPATVTTAITAINSGTLAGQVPGLALINASVAADAAVTTFETDNKAAADALVAKLAALTNTKGAAGADSPTATDTVKADANATFAQKVTALTTDATQFRKDVSADSTTVLNTKASDAATKLATDFAALSSTAKTAANAYTAAIAAEATAKAGIASSIEKGNVVGGLDGDTTADAALASHGNSAATLYSDYVAATVSGRADIDTAFASSTYYSTFKATVVKDAAYADAQAATNTAKNAADAGYVADVTAKTAADAKVVAATAADADAVSVKALADAYAVKTTAASAADTALTTFTAAGVKLIALDGTADSAGTGATVKDVFYFTDKLTETSATPDFKIASFAAGDSIVLGNSYAFNSGALSTGDGNKSEFFLVKSDAGVQIVLEGANYGSSQVTADATTGVLTSTSADHAQVITLTGVTIDHVAVANGVVSYV